MSTLKSAFEESEPNFINILKTLNPDLVVYDFNMSWVAAAASSLKIPAVLFLTCGVVFISFALHFSGKSGNDEKYPFEGIYLKEHEVPHFESLIGCLVNGTRDGDRFLEAIRNSRELILVKSSRDIEGKFMGYLSLLANKKIQPVGSLVQKKQVDDKEDEEIIEWLEEKQESSTVFVSFGSEYFLSKQEMEEIAHGLELSEVNFIWVVRFPVGEKTRVEEVLPKGFLERLGGGKGLVIEGWAPQVKILQHRSIGGFVSHCGWNSVLESINIGVPIVAMPMHIDQPLNARVVEEIGVGVEVKRDIFGKFGREEIARTIRMVVLETKGVDLKDKAREISEKISRREVEEINDVVNEFIRVCGN